MMFVSEYVTAKPYAKPAEATFSPFFATRLLLTYKSCYMLLQWARVATPSIRNSFASWPVSAMRQCRLLLSTKTCHDMFYFFQFYGALQRNKCVCVVLYAKFFLPPSGERQLQLPRPASLAISTNLPSSQCRQRFTILVPCSSPPWASIPRG